MRNKLQLFLLLLFAAAFVFKYLHLTGADILLLTSTGVASIYYYGFTTFDLLNISTRKIFSRSSYQGYSPVLILGCVITGWDYSVLILGILFKILLIPGNTQLLVPGLVFLTLMTITAFFTVRKTIPAVFDRFMKRTLIISGFALIAHVIPAEKLIDLYWSEYPDYSELRKELYHNPQDTALQRQAEVEFRNISESTGQEP